MFELKFSWSNNYTSFFPCSESQNGGHGVTGSAQHPGPWRPSSYITIWRQPQGNNGVFGEHKAIDAFLESYFGYNQDTLGVIAFVLIAFPLVFASGFAVAISKLNFQRR